MSDWKSRPDRRAATDQFCTLLDTNETERANCLRDPKYARDLFKQRYGFDNMPDKVEFRVVDREPQDPEDPGDEWVFMVLYPQGQLPNPVEPVKVWRCTYQPYI